VGKEAESFFREAYDAVLSTWKPRLAPKEALARGTSSALCEGHFEFLDFDMPALDRL